jgi:hypothetical protein
VAYGKALLSAIAGTYLGLMLPAFIDVFRSLSEQKATGLGAIAGGFLGSLFSPWFWLFSLSLFAVFFVASRAHSKFLRVLFFWIPTIFFSTIAVLSAGLFTYTMAHTGRT